MYPFPRFPLWAVCRSVKAYPLLMCFCRPTKPYCSLIKKARKITAVQYNGKQIHSGIESLNYNVLDGYSNEQPSFLICRNAISVDNWTSNRICFGSARVWRIALYGVNISVFALFNDTCMVGYAVAFPIKEYDCSGCRLFLFLRLWTKHHQLRRCICLVKLGCSSSEQGTE